MGSTTSTASRDDYIHDVATEFYSAISKGGVPYDGAWITPEDGAAKWVKQEVAHFRLELECALDLAIADWRMDHADDSKGDPYYDGYGDDRDYEGMRDNDYDPEIHEPTKDDGL